MADDNSAVLRRFRVEWFEWLFFAALLVAAIWWLVELSANGIRCLKMADARLPNVDQLAWQQLAGRWFKMAVASTAALFGLLVLIIHFAFLSRNWSILTNNEGILFVDWRGRQTRIPWSHVCELRVTLPTQLRVPPIKVIGDKVSFTIPQWHILDREELIAQIIAKSGLRPAKSTWRAATYLRAV